MPNKIKYIFRNAITNDVMQLLITIIIVQLKQLKSLNNIKIQRHSNRYINWKCYS